MSNRTSICEVCLLVKVKVKLLPINANVAVLTLAVMGSFWELFELTASSAKACRTFASCSLLMVCAFRYDLLSRLGITALAIVRNSLSSALMD